MVLPCRLILETGDGVVVSAYQRRAHITSPLSIAYCLLDHWGRAPGYRVVYLLEETFL
jgi:hypothetical protein